MPQPPAFVGDLEAGSTFESTLAARHHVSASGREILHVCDTSSAVMSADDKQRTMALVDRCCEVTGYGVRPRLSGGGNGQVSTRRAE